MYREYEDKNTVSGEGIRNTKTITMKPEQFKYDLGTILKKKSGSEWVGYVVGFYSTDQTPEGYCLESIYHKNTVQLYPEKALELVPAVDLK